MSDLKVVEWTAGSEEWDRYIDASPEGTVCHLYDWRHVIQRAYGHRTWYLAATADQEILGVLPLALIQSRIFGRHLVSMPFMDYGGVVTQEGMEVRHALVDAALKLARQHRATLCLRCFGDQGLALPQWLEKVTMLMDLGKSEEELWRRLPSERRNRIRKGLKNGVAVSFHGADALDAFYNVFATNMRDLGSPVHSHHFFRQMFAHLGKYVRIVLVQQQEQVIGAALGLFYKDMISLPWISSLRPFFHLCPNQVLYWETMRFGITHRYRVLDFGRGSKGTGTLEAKRQWRADSVQLYWYYAPVPPPPAGDLARFSRQTELWRRLPLALANTIGPRLRKYIPN